MSDQTQKLTNMNPNIVAFQDELRAKYAEENQTALPDQIDFIGSSLMEIFPIEKFQTEQKLDLSLHIYNRGVRATTIADLLAHIDTLIFDLHPSKIFMNIGSNDVGFGIPENEMIANYNELCRQIQTKLPDCEVYVMAYYPVNTTAKFTNSEREHNSLFHTRTNESMVKASETVARIARKYGFHPINVNQGLTDNQGMLKAELTFDGAHMLPSGYQIVLGNLIAYLK
ncbi:GDSL-type esterase/lipase family protein [Levilactobacillus acidifarinae]|uniref:GDSL-like lipase acylhydrolase family protein n=1 Tax=Levilactobacillus acidifarinae DSM 19394 = JCM 15949 TaxID=1423715 RepID=A0A0R1LQK5_9LACO|nr:GDSL-type esterase/lipase family protein [Levilactobacillus acidifarinae]KRK95907.1 GDSL-like lipase acylhydrolase family protein [Levilactobacillus acidifarinae DSM 19394]GEO69208.1 lysophospholipase [Levilactobacillus acidifarinae]